jgi:hypothetical protein
MRKLLIGAILASFAFVPTGAQASQSVDGFVKSPTRFTDGTTGFPGLGRRLYLVSPETNGLVSYTFAIDEDTRGLDFTLGNVADATGAADLDIYFYYDLGDDVEGTRAAVVADGGYYANVGPGGESGTVPDDANYAIVFTANGVDSTSTYTVE